MHRKGLKTSNLAYTILLVQGLVLPKYGFLFVLIALLGSQGIVRWIVPFLFHFASFLWEPMSHLVDYTMLLRPNKAETAVRGCYLQVGGSLYHHFFFGRKDLVLLLLSP